MSHLHSDTIGNALRNSFIKPSQWVANQLGEGHIIKNPFPSVKIPQQPGVPQVDQAAQNLQQLDRIRARKGVLANLYGGQSGAPPTTGAKQLLGS